MARSPRRPTPIWLVATLVLILAVSLVAGVAYYYSSSSLSAKDREILNLRATGLAGNATILELQVQVAKLEENITVLEQKYLQLEINQTSSKIQTLTLENQILGLQNETARLSLELAVAEGVGNLSVVTYYDNKTVTVPAGATLEMASRSTPSNGTIVFLSPAGCPSSGENGQPSGGQYSLTVALQGGAKPLTSSYTPVGDQAFAVYFQNVGAQPVQCTFSLLYVQG